VGMRLKADYMLTIAGALSFVTPYFSGAWAGFSRLSLRFSSFAIIEIHAETANEDECSC
jgi:hypothetical protein